MVQTRRSAHADLASLRRGVAGFATAFAEVLGFLSRCLAAGLDAFVAFVVFGIFAAFTDVVFSGVALIAFMAGAFARRVDSPGFAGVATGLDGDLVVALAGGFAVVTFDTVVDFATDFAARAGLARFAVSPTRGFEVSVALTAFAVSTALATFSAFIAFAALAALAGLSAFAAFAVSRVPFAPALFGTATAGVVGFAEPLGLALAVFADFIAAGFASFVARDAFVAVSDAADVFLLIGSGATAAFSADARAPDLASAGLLAFAGLSVVALKSITACTTDVSAVVGGLLFLVARLAGEDVMVAVLAITAGLAAGDASAGGVADLRDVRVGAAGFASGAGLDGAAVRAGRRVRRGGSSFSASSGLGMVMSPSPMPSMM